MGGASPQVSGYGKVGCLKEGLAVVRNYGSWGHIIEAGFVDKTGQVVITPQYDDTDTVGGFKNGQAQVGLNDDKTPNYFYIDKTGKVLTKRSSLAEFRKKLAQGDNVRYDTSDSSGKGMILEIKGNLV